MRKIIFIVFGFVLLVLILNVDFSLPLDKERDIDKILLIKHQRKLYLMSRGDVVKEYKVALGRSPKGKKEFEGDGKTPEGIYYIDGKNPHSKYHKNLGISYPNKADRKNAEEAGREPGGLIKIHGMKNGLGFIGKLHRFYDWTEGCIALSDKEIDEIYEAVEVGTEIEIKK